jgi:hypothetical protein
MILEHAVLRTRQPPLLIFMRRWQQHYPPQRSPAAAPATRLSCPRLN